MPYIDLEMNGEVHRLHGGKAYLIRIPRDTPERVRQEFMAQLRAFLQGLPTADRPYVQLVSEDAQLRELAPHELEAIARWYYGYEPLWPGTPPAQDAPHAWSDGLSRVVADPYHSSRWRFSAQARPHGMPSPSRARPGHAIVSFVPDTDTMGSFWLDLPDTQVLGRFTPPQSRCVTVNIEVVTP